MNSKLSQSIHSSESNDNLSKDEFVGMFKKAFQDVKGKMNHQFELSSIDQAAQEYEDEYKDSIFSHGLDHFNSSFMTKGTFNSASLPFSKGTSQEASQE